MNSSIEHYENSIHDANSRFHKCQDYLGEFLYIGILETLILGVLATIVSYFVGDILEGIISG